jgi:hypothetical protein
MQMEPLLSNRKAVSPERQLVLRGLRRASSCMAVPELVLMPAMFLYGYFVIPGHDAHGVRGYIPYVLEITTLLASLVWQMEVYKRTATLATLPDSWPEEREALAIMEDRQKIHFIAPVVILPRRCILLQPAFSFSTKKVFCIEVPTSKVLYVGFSNFVLYWVGMGSALVAGQSFALWSDDRVQADWQNSWKQVPTFGGSLSTIAVVIGIPPLLSLFAILYWIYIAIGYKAWEAAYSKGCGKPFLDRDEWSLQDAHVFWHSLAQSFDVAHIAVLSTLCIQANASFLRRRVREHDFPGRSLSITGEDERFLRFYRIAFVNGPQLWLKVSLLGLTWNNLTWVAKVNMLMPVSLTLAGKVPAMFSQCRFVCRSVKDELANTYKSPYWMRVTTARLIALLVALFFYVGSVLKLVGVFHCKAHIFNLASGCVQSDF